MTEDDQQVIPRFDAQGEIGRDQLVPAAYG